MSLQLVIDRLDARRTAPGRFMALCPGHSDRSPSLRISEGIDGRTLLHCFRGCSVAEILSSSGLTFGDLFAGPAPTIEQFAEADRKRSEAEAISRRRAMEERAYIDSLREGHKERADLLRRVARKVALMADDQEGIGVMVELLHDCIAEERSYHRAIIDDPDDQPPYERPVPPKPFWLEAR